jgi:hypothetical protein
MMPFNAMLAFAAVLGVGSLVISLSDLIKTWRK